MAQITVVGRVVPFRKGRLFLGFLKSWVIAGFFLGLFGLAANPKDPAMFWVWGVFAGFLGGVVLWACTVQAKVHAVYRSASDDARAALVKEAGHVPKYIDSDYWKNWSKGFTGAGIALVGSDILVIQNGVLARIPWECVRKWSWKIEGYNETIIYGGTIADRNAASFDNGAQQARAQSASGLFLTVSDIDNPEWQFRCHNKKVLDRWHEILTQLDEGRIKAA